ncbi:hypothetical protein ABMA28_002322 [Loxostege sticticalis]|uniref:Nose resistant-to-fluoxetine protein N-terminal domain-containing protein n=1 Tax=Loxostege sticticalis TaxID=481309 RepID=A0ABD0T0I4_LOXSC
MLTRIVCYTILLTAHFADGYLYWEVNRPALDQSLYEEALDPVLCQEHLNVIQNDLALRLQFVDAGIRLPRGILEGNTNDLGNYHQCLGINQQLENSELQGKYCLVRVPLRQNLVFPQLLAPEHSEPNLNELISKLQGFVGLKLAAKGLAGAFNDSRVAPDDPLGALGDLELRMAVCLPKTCTTQEAISSLLFNVSEFGFEYREELCRLPNDKPWVAVDYVAVILFSLIGLLSLLSTIYDVVDKHVYKNETQKSTFIIFSIYTNCRRLLNFASGPDALHCVDGIRALAMLWVLIGHTFSSVHFWSNPLVGYEWQQSPEALWLVSATITVDTFFTLSGILVVYTTAGKISGKKLLQNLHLFYLNRLLRMFPVLATGVLIEASILNRLSDGPYWVEVANLVERCRTFWWSTLLHIQNYMSPSQMCIGVTWYLAIDVQLHILSPLVLFWVLSGTKTIAWVALVLAFVLQLTAATVYNFLMEFPSSSLNPIHADVMIRYFQQYYVNTLTRASPFMIGLIVGYILACARGKRVRLAWPIVVLCWVVAAGLLLFCIYCAYPILSPDWDNQVLDNLYNSFIRPIWALGIGWLIFACVHGYAGPINWLLSLQMFKLPARLSYAMYILHYGLMVVVNSSATAPEVWSVNRVMFRFLGHFCLVFMASFVVVLFIDAPCSILFKKILGGGIISYVFTFKIVSKLFWA